MLVLKYTQPDKMDVQYTRVNTSEVESDNDEPGVVTVLQSEDAPLLGRTSPTGADNKMPSDKYKESQSDAVEKKMTKGRLFIVGCILVMELCERLTYYSVVANMVLFCSSKLKYSDDDASVITLVFSGTVFIIPVFGGMISDTLAGKYNTILGAGLIYLLGLFLLPASAVDYRDWFGGEDDLSLETRKVYFFLGLTFVAIGTGGIKANVGPFGAQQVEDLGDTAVQSFFNWFYWFINAGAIVAYSGVAYVQQEVGFDYGFLIPLLSMLLALSVFIISKSRYRHIPCGGSIVQTSVLVCVQSCNGCKNPSWNNARKEHGGRYDSNIVDGVIAVMRILPVFILIIIYWAVYSQMSTSLFLQSERMNISVGDTKLPAALLNIFNTLIILVLIPIMDLIVYPALAKCGKSPTHLQRIGIGMVLVALSMVYAGILEIYRKKDIEAHGAITQTLGDQTFEASQLTMFAQIPEFAFIGSSEVFASISGLEFAYTQAPKFMQGLIMGLFLMTSGLGSYVASLLVTIVKSWRTDDASDWYPKEPNNGHLEYMMFLLAALAGVNLLIFIFVARWYKYKVPEIDESIPVESAYDEKPAYDNRSYVNDNSEHPYGSSKL